jgi:hypothetical protein
MSLEKTVNLLTDALDEYRSERIETLQEYLSEQALPFKQTYREREQARELLSKIKAAETPDKIKKLSKEAALLLGRPEIEWLVSFKNTVNLLRDAIQAYEWEPLRTTEELQESRELLSNIQNAKTLAKVAALLLGLPGLVEEHELLNLAANAKEPLRVPSIITKKIAGYSPQTPDSTYASDNEGTSPLRAKASPREYHSELGTPDSGYGPGSPTRDLNSPIVESLSEIIARTDSGFAEPKNEELNTSFAYLEAKQTPGKESSALKTHLLKYFKAATQAYDLNRETAYAHLVSKITEVELIPITPIRAIGTEQELNKLIDGMTSIKTIVQTALKKIVKELREQGKLTQGYLALIITHADNMPLVRAIKTSALQGISPIDCLLKLPVNSKIVTEAPMPKLYAKDFESMNQQTSPQPPPSRLVYALT